MLLNDLSRSSGVMTCVPQEVKLIFPGAQRMNRGNHEVGSLVKACRANNVTDLVVIHETRGQPGTAQCPILAQSRGRHPNTQHV